MEQTTRMRGKHLKMSTGTAGTFAENGHRTRVATEMLNVVANPPTATSLEKISKEGSYDRALISMKFYLLESH